jgi:hypothetical protein
MLPRHGVAFSVFLLANAARYSTHASVPAWVNAARARASYMAAATDLETPAHALLETQLAYSQAGITVVPKLRALSDRADRPTLMATITMTISGWQSGVRSRGGRPSRLVEVLPPRHARRSRPSKGAAKRASCSDSFGPSKPIRPAAPRPQRPPLSAAPCRRQATFSPAGRRKAPSASPTWATPARSWSCTQRRAVTGPSGSVTGDLPSYQEFPVRIYRLGLSWSFPGLMGGASQGRDCSASVA